MRSQGPQIGGSSSGKATTEGEAAAPMGDAPVVRVASIPTVPVPAPAVSAPAAAERAAKDVAPDGSGAESEPKRITQAQETQLLAMITEVSSLVRKTRAELATLTEVETKSRASVEGKLEDFERRLNLSEARRALDEAKDVSVAPPASPQAQPAPPAPAPAGKAKGGPQKGVATASMQTDGAVSTTPPRYRVQAASPGLAMLAEVERSGEESAPLQVAVGGEVPGYGRVTKISQRGSEWVVQTEKGPIQ